MREIEVILSLSRIPSLPEFLKLLGVRPSGLAAQLTEYVYRDMFVMAIDVRKEYNRYYSIEYSTLSEFVECKYNETLSDEELEKEYILFVGDISGFADQLYEENYLDVILDAVYEWENSSEN